jgi:hypothetical protein
MYKQAYLYKPWVDILFIIAPPFLCWICVLLFQNTFTVNDNLGQWWWLILVLGVDVTHVYTTLYKTYFNKQNFEQHKKVFTIIPFLCFIAAFLLYAMGTTIFWTTLAYIAVFHFIRQQYGFMRLYSRNEEKNNLHIIDTIAIYSATIYPIIYWHLKGPFNFEWFVPNDFMFFKSNLLHQVSLFLYNLVLIIWIIKECCFFYKNKYVNILKTGVIVGTYIAWYYGIVYYEADLTFTLFNVVCHGIPYMALVWIDQIKSQSNNKPTITQKIQKLVFQKKHILLFIAIPLVLAFCEEFLWNSFVWQEKKIFFEIGNIFQFMNTAEVKQLLVPLLILPQLTHYVIDGFIWKISKGHIST